MNTNFLGKLFKAISDTINGAEKSFLDLLSALVPYAVPIIPAYLTYFHTTEQMNFPPQIGYTAAFVVEVLGMASVSTTIRFWRHNQKYKASGNNRAPFMLALATYIFYIVIVLSVNVILEMVSNQRGGWVIFSIGLFTLLSVPSGVLISIRAQYSEMLEERQASRRQTSADAGFSKDVDGVHFGNGREKIEKICESCGKNFVTTFPNKRTCSDACRKRLSRSKSQSV